MYIVDSRKKMYVKFIANQLEKPAVVDRLTNQLWRAIKPRTTGKGHHYLKTVVPPLDTFMKDNQLKAL